jgi:hypothetical protein
MTRACFEPACRPATPATAPVSTGNWMKVGRADDDARRLRRFTRSGLPRAKLRGPHHFRTHSRVAWVAPRRH